MNTMAELFAQLHALVSQYAGFFTAVGIQTFSAFAVIIVVWHGIEWALTGGMAMDRFAGMLMKLAFGYSMIHFYSTPLGIFGGRDFHHLITDEGEYLANALNNGATTNLYTALDNLIAGLKQPGLASLLNVPEILAWAIVFVAVIFFEAAMWIVIGWGYIASSVCVLIGPVLIPFFLVPQLDWMFWGWVKSFIQYSFYPVIGNAVVFVFSRLLVGFIGRHGPPWDSANQWALMAPMVILLVAATFGILKIPTLVSDIFSGRSGSSAIPNIFG